MKKIVLHSPLKSGPKGVSPFVSLGVDTPNGMELLSVNLATDKEVDFAIDRLKDQLEELRKDAKRELKRLLAASLAP